MKPRVKSKSVYSFVFKGKDYDVPRDELLDALHHSVKGGLSIAQSLHYNHVSGFPDLKGWYKPRDTEADKLIRKWMSLVDSELHQHWLQLEKHFAGLLDIDEEMISWLIAYSKAPNRKRLQSKLKKILDPPSGPVGPIWVMTQAYQVLVDKSKRELDEMTVLADKMDKLIARLRAE